MKQQNKLITAEKILSKITTGVSQNPKVYNRLGVDNDQDALALFLRRAGRRSHETLRRYTRELVRFTAFARKELNKGYRQITLADVEIYVDFLHKPWPAWKKPGINKELPEKVYFPNHTKQGKSTDQIITVLNSFFNYIHTTGYSSGNPFSAFDKSGEKHARGHGHLPFFFKDEWDIVLKCISHYPVNTEMLILEKARIHYIFSLTYGGALRESELTNHSCLDIRPDKDGQLTLYIRGKGRKLRQLPVTPDMHYAINLFREFHKAGNICADKFPLAPQLKPIKWLQDGSIEFKSMGARGIRKWFSQFMQYCSSTVEDNTDNLAERLLTKTFHSLRHTALSHLAQRMDIEDLAIFAGHESITTTQQYYTPEKERLRELTQHHKLHT